MNVNHRIEEALNSHISEIEKIDRLNDIVDDGNVSSVDLNHAAPYCDVLKLIKIKVLMNVDMKNQDLDGLIKEMASHAVMYSSNVADSNSYTDIYIRTLAGDLTSDYYYLMGDTEYTMIDLINRKMLILNGIPAEYGALKQWLQLKTLEVLVVSNYDFRMVSMIQSITDNLDILEIGEATQRLVELILGCRIITSEDLNSYLQNTKNAFLKKLDYTTLFVNIVQHSIHNLSRYYTRILIHKIPKILSFNEEASNMALDDFIADMIINQKLPAGTTIDQKEQLLIYGQDISDEYNPFNMHIKQTAEIINNIESRIASIA